MNALILDGATGERMKPITNWMPKDLMRIDGKSLLERHIEALQKNKEIEKIAITVHQHKDKVLKAIKLLDNGDKPLIPHIEEKLQGTGYATLNVWRLLGKEKPLMIIYGDVYFHLCPGCILVKTIEEYLFRRGRTSILGVNPSPKSTGFTRTDSKGIIKSFSEKEPLDDTNFYHAGLLILAPWAFPLLESHYNELDPYNLGEHFLPMAIKKGRFYAYNIGEHQDIGTIDQYYTLQQKIYNKKLRRRLRTDLIPIFKALLETEGIIWIIGNGGSFAVAQHACLDFTKAAGRASIPLSDPVALTAYANDISFEDSFSSQLKGVWGKEDALIALSTSGESSNILKAVDNANKEGVKTIGLTSKGSSLAKKAKIVLEFDERDPKVLEDLFSISMHLLTRLLEDVKK